MTEHICTTKALTAGDYYFSYNNLPSDAVVGEKEICDRAVANAINGLIDEVNILKEEVKKLKESMEVDG